MRNFRFMFMFISALFFCGIIANSNAYNYTWEIDETPQGTESSTRIQPVHVMLLDEPIQVPSHSAALRLIERYSVYLDKDWSSGHAYKLLQAFQSIPQPVNNYYDTSPTVAPSLWRLSSNHIQDDIMSGFENGYRVVTIAEAAFSHATPRLAEIEGVRGRFFSQRLHHAVVRFVTDNGADRYALEKILRERYGISINVPDYAELTRYTTAEHAGRFSTFKNEELIALATMLEEFPSGMHKIPGLKYIVRRLDGTPHPLYPEASAVAWPQSGYIEFMESAFKGQGAGAIHHLILHEKAHFLWEYLFDRQLKQDWIELGGWYENPEAPDGWSTTKQLEFVSAYAHGRNPEEDMAESIGSYIVRPDKLRSRAPAKYAFIQERIMHGTRYISRIRQDLTFEVYNLYPDFVYPGRIVRVDIQVQGKPEEDKHITVTLKLHSENAMDTAQNISLAIVSDKATNFGMWLYPVNADGEKISSGYILKGHATLSRYAAHGYWAPESITLMDAHGNERHHSQTDFGWKLYVNNPLADNEPPAYVKDSMRLSLSHGSEAGRAYQIVNAQWKIFEETGINVVFAAMNDENSETYSRKGNTGEYNPHTGEAWVKLIIPDYFQSGTYSLNYINMMDVGLNRQGVYFTHPWHALGKKDELIDELPATIDIVTTNPDSKPPVLDLNQLSIQATPTNPEAPNGETMVDITFKIKDDISGYRHTDIRLRDPQGVKHGFGHDAEDVRNIYASGVPTQQQTYQKRIILPVGSIPGTWGLAEMEVWDKAQNMLRVDFTEIVRFEVNDAPVTVASDVNQDGTVNIQDLVQVAQQIGKPGPSKGPADVNRDGTINIQDLVQIANHFGESQ